MRLARTTFQGAQIMKTSIVRWSIAALVVAALSLGIGVSAYGDGPTFPIPATPIPPQPNRPVPSYIGQPAVPKPIAAPTIPANPFMGSWNNIQSWSALHNDAYMSDTYFTQGPLGR